MNNNSLSEQLIIDIIAQQLDLSAERIWVRNQNRKIPPDNGLYVVVGMVDAAPISSTSDVTSTEDGMIETQRVILSENIQIDVFSRDDAALRRRWEVMTALKSVYAQQVQEANYFKIYRMPRSFVNTSDAEGSSRLNRFTLTFPCQVWYKKEIPLTLPGRDYYNDFDTRVDDANTIGEDEGLIEFNIKES